MDISGNDLITNDSEENFSEEVEGKAITEEGLHNEYETTALSTVDYTQYFENIQNDIHFNSALLLGFLLVFALLTGLRKL